VPLIKGLSTGNFKKIIILSKIQKITQLAFSEQIIDLTTKILFLIT